MASFKWIILVLLFFACASESSAQSGIDSLRKANMDRKIALKSLVGDWYYGDSLQYKIEFLAQGNYYVIMLPQTVGVGPYGFIIDKDSVWANGTAPNWPPYDCILNLIDEKTLEIWTFQYYHENAFHSVYKRK